MYETDRWMSHYINGVRMNCVSENDEEQCSQHWKMVNCLRALDFGEIIYLFISFHFLFAATHFLMSFTSLRMNQVPMTHPMCSSMICKHAYLIGESHVYCIIMIIVIVSVLFLMFAMVSSGKRKKTEPQTDNLVHLVCTYVLIGSKTFAIFIYHRCAKFSTRLAAFCWAKETLEECRLMHKS